MSQNRLIKLRANNEPRTPAFPSDSMPLYGLRGRLTQALTGFLVPLMFLMCMPCLGDEPQMVCPMTLNTGSYTVTAQNNGTDPGTQLILWEQGPGVSGNSFVKLKLPQEGDVDAQYIVASRSSGLVIYSQGGGTLGGTQAVLSPYVSGKLSKGSAWDFRQAASSTDYQITSFGYPDMGLGIQGDSTINGELIILSEDATTWSVAESTAECLQIVSPSGLSDCNNGNKVPDPQYDGTADPPSGPLICLGFAQLPFVLVRDPTRVNQSEQVKNSPVYTLTYSEFWQADDKTYQSPYPSSHEVEETVTVGASSKVIASMEKVFGFSLTASTSVEYGGVSASIEASIYGEERWSRMSEENFWEDRTLTEKYKVPKGLASIAYVKYGQWDLYDIQGRKVWSQTAPSDQVSHLYAAPPSTF